MEEEITKTQNVADLPKSILRYYSICENFKHWKPLLKISIQIEGLEKKHLLWWNILWKLSTSKKIHEKGIRISTTESLASISEDFLPLLFLTFSI